MYTNVRTRKQLGLTLLRLSQLQKLRSDANTVVPWLSSKKKGCPIIWAEQALVPHSWHFVVSIQIAANVGVVLVVSKLLTPRGIPYALCCFGRIQWDKPRSWSFQTVRCRSLANLSGLTWLGKKTHLSNGRNLKFLFWLFACSNCSKIQLDYFVFPIKNKKSTKNTKCCPFWQVTLVTPCFTFLALRSAWLANGTCRRGLSVHEPVI